MPGSITGRSAKVSPRRRHSSSSTTSEKRPVRLLSLLSASLRRSLCLPEEELLLYIRTRTTRRCGNICDRSKLHIWYGGQGGWNRIIRSFYAASSQGIRRSEEHTSELQSLRHLVCTP